ncbi:MAG: extracellular solute-binding protein [Eubacterium sp.]|nr:extracellular solute-binding protein [Eubacterium sp.]
MTTIKDVAKRSGVSIATVSNYLNHTKPVSKKTSQKIKAAIDDLQYSQNFSAKSLKSHSYNDIGVILPNLTDSYYVQMFQGIENIFQDSGYYVNLAFSYDIPDYEQNIVHNFLKKQICGLILVSCQPNNWKFYYDYFTSDHKPLVLIDRNIQNLDTNFVSFDNFSIIKSMTTDLLNFGYRDTYLMSGPTKFSCESDCIRGFQEAFQQNSINLDPSFLLKTNLSKEDAFRKTIQLLKERKPDAIVSTSESMATGIIEAFTILGYRTEEIPVITLGEEHWNSYTHSMTNVSASRPAIKLGQTASNLLMEHLKSPFTKENERIILKDTSLQKPMPLFRAGTITNSPSESKQPQKTIRALMLDTPQVHSLQGLIRNFEIKTNIHVDITILPHRYMYEKILENHKLKSQKEQPYDVFMYDIPWLSLLASEHILEDITQQLNHIDLNIFLSDCLKYYSNYQQHYYGIPFMYAPQIFYYRKDLFEDAGLKADYEKQNNITLRPPLTLKEFNTIADFFTNKTDRIDYGISVPAAYDECLVPEIHMRLRAYNGDFFDSKGNMALDSQQTLKAYINFVRSVKVAKPNYRNADDNSVVQEFLQGETAMLITYPSFLTNVVDLRRSSLVGSIGYHHIPGRCPLLGGWGMGISTVSRSKKEAFEFLRWTCDEQVANYLTLLGGQSAITSTLMNDELIKLYPWLPLYHSTYAYCKPPVSPSLNRNSLVSQNNIDAIICKWIYDLLDDKIEVQDAVSNTRRELEELLKNNG